MTTQARNYKRAKRAINGKLRPLTDALEHLTKAYHDGIITHKDMLQQLQQIEKDFATS